MPTGMDLEDVAADVWAGRWEDEKVLATVDARRARAFELFETSSAAPCSTAPADLDGFIWVFSPVPAAGGGMR